MKAIVYILANRDRAKAPKRIVLTVLRAPLSPAEKKSGTVFLKRLFGAKEAQSRFKDPRRGYDNYVMQTGPIAAERALEIEQEKKVRKLLKKARVVVVPVPIALSSKDHFTTNAGAVCVTDCDAGSC